MRIRVDLTIRRIQNCKIKSFWRRLRKKSVRHATNSVVYEILAHYFRDKLDADILAYRFALEVGVIQWFQKSTVYFKASHHDSCWTVVFKAYTLNECSCQSS